MVTEGKKRYNRLTNKFPTAVIISPLRKNICTVETKISKK
jgi:hypothetical protein